MEELKLDLRPRFSKDMGFFSKKGITGTFLAEGGLHGETAGSKRHMYYKGKGLEFDGYREYTFQDDAKTIDWKATLRANKKLVRVFNEERNKNIIFLFDVSSSMCYGSIDKLKVEYAAELISSLAYSFEANGDSIGLVMFADGLKHVRTPSVGNPQWILINRDLANPRNYEGGFSLVKTIKEFFSFVKGEAVVFLVTDFIGLENDNGWEKYFEIMSARFELVNIMIRDPLDNYLPQGVGEVVISNPYDNTTICINADKIRLLYNSYNGKYITKIKEFCEKLETDFLMLETNVDFEKPVVNFLIRREIIWR